MAQSTISSVSVSGWLSQWRERWSRTRRGLAFGYLAGGLALTVCCLGVSAADGVQVLFSTGFEPPTYEAGFTLAGQDGWLSYPTDADGSSQIVSNFFPGQGQQALLGYVAPPATNDSASAYRPLEDPVAMGKRLVTFRVSMAIFDSESTTNRDSFRWSVYNRAQGGTRLFSLEFDNQTQDIYYVLDDDQVMFTGYSFERDGLYDLELTMNFASNVWSASLSGELIVNALPITTPGRNSTLNLGDIDAVWVIGLGNKQFGNNYMVFDDYQVTAVAASAPLPPQLTLVSVLPRGDTLLRLVGEPGRSYAIDASQNFSQWTALKTNTPVDGSFDYLDTNAASQAVRFYRARAVSP